MRDLRISPDLALPIDVAGEAIAILAKRGAGKTNTATVLVEELYAAGVQVVVLDPVGAWWGLRSSGDGQSEGLAVPIVGGQRGDVPLEPTAGALIADVVVDTGQSLLLDLSDFPSKAATERFALDFADRLFRRKARAPSLVHVVFEEADTFAPQSPKGGFRGDAGKMAAAIEQIVRRGRARGIGITMVTQRSAVLNKDVLSQADVLVAMRTTSPHDVKAIKLWVDAHGHDELGVVASLPSLETGEAWFWNPEHGLLDRVKVRRRRTFDSSATPKAGERQTQPRELASIDLAALGAEIAKTAERAKADDPKELRKQIRALQKEIAERPTETQTIEVEKIVEVPILDGQVDQLREVVDRLAGVANDFKDGSVLLEGVANGIIAAVEPAAQVRPAPAGPAPARLAAGKAGRTEGRESRIRRPSAPQPVTRVTAAAAGDLAGGPRKILEALASRYPMRATRAQLGTLSGYSFKGGTFQKYLSILKRDGLLDERGGEITVTEQGLDYFGGTPPAPQTPDEVREMWLAALEGGPRRLLEQLIAHHGSDITREDLGELAGYEAAGGTFQKYLSILRRNELVVIDGGYVRASDDLFIA